MYIEAEGDKFALDSLLEFCNEGPDRAEVETVEIEESQDLRSFKNFEVLKRVK